ncbi:MAG: butyrate kinase [Bacteroidota bacterium]
MTSDNNILVINPGSTSTKLAIFQNTTQCKAETINHSSSELHQYPSLWEQFPFRLKICREWASRYVKECSAVVSMGGLFRPMPGGVYKVTDKMRSDARKNLQGEHASNLGCELAYTIASNYQAPAFIVDPVSVDEFEPLAYYSGHPMIKRRSLSHALNIHAAARHAATELKIPLYNSSFIIAHIGGGISVAPVRNGKIIDVNDAASDGPFSPERTGGLPLQQFIGLCFSGKYTEAEMRKFVMGKGGLAAYLGTNSVIEVEQKINAGDTAAREIYQAMAYQIAKEIGAMATVLEGKVNAVVLTGAIARSEMFTTWIMERVQFLAPVIIFPGEDEMRALAEGALRVLQGQEQYKEY